MIFPVKRLADLGFEILATEGTAEVLRRNGVQRTVVRKLSEGTGPDGEPTIVDADPGRRGRHGRQHPVRRRPRASTATRSAPPRRAWTGRSSRPSSSSARPSRASRRPGPARSRCGSLQEHAALLTGSAAGPHDRRRVIYEHAVRPLLFRLDAERAHRVGLAGLAVASRAVRPAPPAPASRVEPRNRLAG